MVAAHWLGAPGLQLLRRPAYGHPHRADIARRPERRWRVKWQSRAGWLFLLALVACGSDDDSPDPDGVSGNGGAGAPAAHGGSGAASGESGIAALSGAGGAIGGGSGGAASALRALPACTEA